MLQLKSDTLYTVNHGFFGRIGGVSEGIYTSLNCGSGSADDPARVAENRARVAARFGVKDIFSLYQVHSAIVHTISAPLPGRPEGDALVTNTPGLALGILTADCAPVLLADAKAGVVAAAHAGWKGAMGGVLEATVSAMRALGAQEISAAIGPCIGQTSYEVGAEFIARFLDESAENAMFFKDSHFDLRAYVAHRLAHAGVARCEALPHDTCADEARFFSYRRATLRAEGGYGRQISCIVIDDSMLRRH